MHGIRREDFYTSPEEKEAFSAKLVKGFKLLDSFVAAVHRGEDSIKDADGISALPADADRMLELSGDIIDFMPEFYPSWNYRKNYLLQGKLESDRLSKFLLEELEFTESVLKKAPKCYAVWHHRLWVITTLFNMRIEELRDILRKELSLCMMLFRLDARNFHGWNHVNFVRHFMNKLEPSPELGSPSDADSLCYQSVGTLIEKNFSNYSAWFHRACLSETCGTLESDLDSLTPAIYTDPNDQCLWHHLDWLLYHRNTLTVYPVRCHLFEEQSAIVVFFNDCALLSPSASSVSIHRKCGETGQIEGKWQPVTRAGCYNKLGKAHVPQHVWKFQANRDLKIADIASVSLSLVIETNQEIVENYYEHMINNARCKSGSTDARNEGSQPTLLQIGFSLEPKVDGDLTIDVDSFTFMRRKSNDDWKDLSSILRGPVRLPSSTRIVTLGRDVTPKTLENQLDVINSLIDMGTDSKYLHLARSKIKRHLGDDPGVEECYKAVKVIDPHRSSMYEDLLRKELIQEAMDRAALSGVTSVSLRGMQITNLCYSAVSSYLGLQDLDLGENCLSERSLADFAVDVMLGLRHLSLANNGFTSLRTVLSTLRNLDSLESLNLRGNPIGPLGQDIIEAMPPSLSKIEITDTPLIQWDTDHSKASTEQEFSIHTPFGKFRLHAVDECKLLEEDSKHMEYESNSYMEEGRSDINDISNVHYYLYRSD